ncbi:hypothetical protein BpHYR1_028929 [Brachionus plicatilis]|uniref:Uncharacterized protein n=1 Tax=Brachionus plicatilis TaxID=10195 RepID=A0A3M7RS63_BRAPC|nr:hypothetical protein BpHYR1_028929 [Brachionus plicatilis]
MKFSLSVTVLSTLFLVTNSFKIAFDNDNNMLRMESNILHNGKPVNEPSPSEAIRAVSDLGFKVVNLEDNDGEDLNLLRAKQPRESIYIRPKEPIDKIFQKILSSKDRQRNLNYQRPHDAKVSHHKIQLDHAKYGSFDIYITNVNENLNQNNGTQAYEN